MSRVYARHALSADEKLAFDRRCLTCEARPGEACEMQNDREHLVQGFHEQRWAMRHSFQYEGYEVSR
jgi:hypothetical protein